MYIHCMLIFVYNAPVPLLAAYPYSSSWTHEVVSTAIRHL